MGCLRVAGIKSALRVLRVGFSPSTYLPLWVDPVSRLI